MATLSENVAQAISDFNSIKAAIINKGVEVPSGTPTSQYAEKIEDIQAGDFIYESYTQSAEYLFKANISIIGGFRATIPNGIKTIGAGAFAKNGIVTIVDMPNTVITIESGSRTGTNVPAFWECNELVAVTMSPNLESIGNEAFYGCSKLWNVDIPQGVITVGTEAFAYTAIERFVIPDSVIHLGFGACRGCTHLERAEVYGSHAVSSLLFADCTNLKEVVISANVTAVYQGAFQNCTALTDVYYMGTQEQWQNVGIGSDNTPLQNATIHYNYVPE
jgi:hypothetical protein